MKITVQISVKADGIRAPYPAAFTFDYEHNAGDNPAFYGSEVQEAVGKAALAAVEGVEPYVRHKIGEEPS